MYVCVCMYVTRLSRLNNGPRLIGLSDGCHVKCDETHRLTSTHTEFRFKFKFKTQPSNGLHMKSNRCGVFVQRIARHSGMLVHGPMITAAELE